jgi:hypothetical protein
MHGIVGDTKEIFPERDEKNNSACATTLSHTTTPSGKPVRVSACCSALFLYPSQQSGISIVCIERHLFPEVFFPFPLVFQKAKYYT